jgi:hypothetical protein
MQESRSAEIPNAKKLQPRREPHQARRRGEYEVVVTNSLGTVSSKSYVTVHSKYTWMEEKIF